MAKSNPIGVRFDERILEKYPELSPQKILNKLTEQDLEGKISFKIKTVKDQEPENYQVEQGPVLLEAKYDFRDAKFLIVENFTKYPLKDKPIKPFEQTEWLKKKAIADAEIKEAWNNR